MRADCDTDNQVFHSHTEVLCLCCVLLSNEKVLESIIWTLSCYKLLEMIICKFRFIYADILVILKSYYLNYQFKLIT